jgi:transposase
MQSQKRRQYTAECKHEAVRLITEHGYGVTEAARNLGINAHMLGRWKPQVAQQKNAVRGNGHLLADHEELLRLRQENQRLRMEREMLKNPLKRAAAPLVSGETLGSRLSSFSGRSGRSLIGGAYHPVKKRGPGELADLPLVTPSGDPV